MNSQNKSVAPAWQAREHQQQVFLEKTMAKIWEEEPERVNGYFREEILFGLIIVLTQRRQAFLSEKNEALLAEFRPERGLIPASWQELLGRQTAGMKQLLDSIVLEVTKFSRAPEEADFLLAKVAVQLMDSIHGAVGIDLMRMLFLDPRKVLGVADRTQEIEYET